jgi:hypothetical protein
MSEDSKFRHKGGDNTAPYPVSRMAPAVELVDLAKEIAQADQMLNLQVNNKLGLIADQIKTLQETARHILETAQRDQMLNQADCNFNKLPGKIYHLYTKPNGNSYLSMLSPNDWGGEAPHQYGGGFRFEADYSWTPVEEIQQNQDNSILQALLT